MVGVEVPTLTLESPFPQTWGGRTYDARVQEAQITEADIVRIQAYTSEAEARPAAGLASRSESAT